MRFFTSAPLLITFLFSSLAAAQTSYAISATCSATQPAATAVPSAVIHVNSVVENNGAYTGSVYFDLVFPPALTKYKLQALYLYPTTGEPPVAQLCFNVENCAQFMTAIELSLGDFPVASDMSVRPLHFDASFTNEDTGAVLNAIYYIGCNADELHELDRDTGVQAGPGGVLVPFHSSTHTQRTASSQIVPSSILSPRTTTTSPGSGSGSSSAPGSQAEGTSTEWVDASSVSCITSTFTTWINPTSCITLTTTITLASSTTNPGAPASITAAISSGSHESNSHIAQGTASSLTPTLSVLSLLLCAFTALVLM